MVTNRTSGRRRGVLLLFAGVATLGLTLAGSGIASAIEIPPREVTGNAPAAVDPGTTDNSDPQTAYFFSDFLKQRLVTVCYQDPGRGKVCQKVLVPK